MKSFDLLTRRDALKKLGVGAAVMSWVALGRPAEGASANAAGGIAAANRPPFTLPPLGYDFGALEPHIDARTMEIHHGRHHQTYITNANAALAGQPELGTKSAAELLRHLDAIPESIRDAVRHNVGGHLNHSFFWPLLRPDGGGAPTGPLAEAIRGTFGSFENFQAQFGDAATSRFGSGWAWLVVKAGALSVESTANQDSPISRGGTPVLGLDVWEHAYYLRYQNRRKDYVAAFWNVVNWERAAGNFAAAR